MACTTVRTPVCSIDEEVALRAGRPEPQVELWVESDRPLSRLEASRAREEAQAALRLALEGRAQQDGDLMLVVRAQGVTRTRGYRAEQAAATAGLVVGAVVVVAAVVVALVAGGKGGGRSPARGLSGVAASGHHVAGKVPGALGSATRLAHAPLRPVVPAPRLPRVPAQGPRFPSAPAPGPHPWRSGRGLDLDVGFNWALPLDPPQVPSPLYFDCCTPPAAPELGAAEDAPAIWEAEAPPRAPEPDLVLLDPPPRLAVEDRGFFDGDRLLLEAVLLDPSTGEALWEKRLGRKADPRDPRAVRAAVDELLSPGGWLPPAPPGDQGPGLP
jgi:hypothetical protein